MCHNWSLKGEYPIDTYTMTPPCRFNCKNSVETSVHAANYGLLGVFTAYTQRVTYLAAWSTSLSCPPRCQTYIKGRCLCKFLKIQLVSERLTLLTLAIRGATSPAHLLMLGIVCGCVEQVQDQNLNMWPMIIQVQRDIPNNDLEQASWLYGCNPDISLTSLEGRFCSIFASLAALSSLRRLVRASFHLSRAAMMWLAARGGTRVVAACRTCLVSAKALDMANRLESNCWCTNA